MTSEEAIRLAETRWWEECDDNTIVRFQLFEEKLCMDFPEFHRALESVLDRPVFTHELAFVNEPHGLKNEYLGEADPPTFEEIINLIPEEKRVIVFLDDPETREESG